MDKSILQLKDELKELLNLQPEIIAAWEGGSAATGFLDEFSDLDLGIAINTDDVEPIFALLETHFSKNYGILDKFRMPEPCWHGMSQCFYHLDKMPELFYCDIAVVKKDNPSKFTEPDRHGNASVWFDKANIVSAKPTSEEELNRIANRMYHIATDTDWLGIIELKKALARQNWLASHMNYIIFISRHLIPLMNLKYRPCKADFGIRYAERDFPEAEAELLQNLMQVTSCKEIEERFALALPLFNQLKNELAHFGINGKS